MKISEKFEKLKEKKEKALIGFITVGDPTPKDTIFIAKSLIEGGVDIIELGLPFSDPLADGPTIQKASLRALNSGMNPNIYFEIVKEIKGIPKVCLTYYNLILQRGIKKFVKDCQKSEILGLIVPDLPIEEAKPLLKFCNLFDVDLIFLIAPTTPKERIKKISKSARGFLYLVSLLGTTGEREKLSKYVKPLINRVKSLSLQIPLCVGFGISKPEHVKEILKAGADGVILGSAFVKIIEKNLKNKKNLLFELKNFAKKLKEKCKF